MPFKRPGPQPNEAASSSSRSVTPSRPPPAKRARLSSRRKKHILKDITLHILDAKLQPEMVAELYTLAESGGAKLVGDVEEADVVVTAIGMRKRLERHVSWNVAKTKSLVTPAWLRDSLHKGTAQSCGDYAAIPDLQPSTAANCPTDDSDSGSDSDSDSPTANILQESPPSSAPSSHVSQSKPSASRSDTHSAIPANLLPPNPPTPFNPKALDPLAKFACQRPSPLKCANQKLAEDLDVMRSWRELEGEERSALSYRKAVSAIKAYPTKITSTRDIQKLLFVGVKISSMIEQFIDQGYVSEVRTTLHSARFKTLTIFNSIYGIGPHTARQLYALGLSSLEQLERYYDVEGAWDDDENDAEDQEEGALELPARITEMKAEQSKDLGHDSGGGGGGLPSPPASDESETLQESSTFVPAEPEPEAEAPVSTSRTKPKDIKLRGTTTMLDEEDVGAMPKEEIKESWIKIALGLREDLSVKIPRDEVREIHRVIMEELDELQPGCVSTIVGGYRRGKDESNDVDIVFTHPDPEKAKGLCKKFMHVLYDKGLVTHVMHLSSFHAHNALRTTHWDSLEKALTVFILPDTSPIYPLPSDPNPSTTRRRRRRVDFIFSQPKTYWTAVVGWTGSMMFERDLRSWAKRRGLKFDSSGITRRRDSKLIYPRTEKEVFDCLGLPWIDPTMRNADV